MCAQGIVETSFIKQVEQEDNRKNANPKLYRNDVQKLFTSSLNLLSLVFFYGLRWIFYFNCENLENEQLIYAFNKMLKKPIEFHKRNFPE